MVDFIVSGPTTKLMFARQTMSTKRFHHLAANTLIRCHRSEEEFWLSRSLTNFSMAETFDKYPERVTSEAGLRPKPPLETGKVS